MKTKAFEEELTTVTAQPLAQLLADTYILYLKTQNFHWNVEDQRFYFLHKMLEEQYEELAEAVDLIAERLRAINCKAPASMKQFLALTVLEEAEGDFSANEMIQQLLNDHVTIAKNLHPCITEANSEHDDGTGDLFIERLRAHEKTAWMLRSHLNKR